MTSLLGEIQAFPGAPPAWLSCSGLTGGTGSSPSLAQGAADDPCPCDTSVTPSSALSQLTVTAGTVASPCRSSALRQGFAGNKGQDFCVSVGAQNSEFLGGESV